MYDDINLIYPQDTQGKISMQRLLALLSIVTLSSALPLAAAAGENLLINGGFDAEQVDFPEFWSPSSTKDVGYNRAGGPEGKKASVVLKSDGPSPSNVSLRQQGMTLVAGETYKLWERWERWGQAVFS